LAYLAYKEKQIAFEEAEEEAEYQSALKWVANLPAELQD